METPQGVETRHVKRSEVAEGEGLPEAVDKVMNPLEEKYNGFGTFVNSTVSFSNLKIQRTNSNVVLNTSNNYYSGITVQGKNHTVNLVDGDVYVDGSEETDPETIGKIIQQISNNM